MKKSYVAIASFFICDTAFAVQLTCPPLVKVTQSVLQAPEGWNAVNNRGEERLLVGASFTDGPPEQLADLKPHSERKRGKADVLTWKLDNNYPEGLWLSCRYRDTTVVLAQKLPQGLTSCRITYPNAPHPSPVIKSIECH